MRKMRLLFLGVLFFAWAGVFQACSGDDDGEPGSFQESDMLSFSISGYTAEAQIDVANRNIWLQLPETQKTGKGLTPVFALSEGATASVQGTSQESGVSKVDFNGRVTYKVKAADGSTSDWKVTVTNNKYTVDWGLGCFLSEEHSNNGSRPKGYYLQQQNTGAYSSNNCGPAVATMAAMWSDPQFSKSVSEARDAIPRGQDGGINWYPGDLYSYLSSNGIPSKTVQLPSTSLSDVQLRAQFQDQVRGYVDAGELVVLCLNMSYVSYYAQQDPEFRVNKYYDAQFGHFILVKGYKIVDGRAFFEVHDPWGLDKKYADGTYKGANRYYLSDELSKTPQHNRNAVVVSSLN